MLKIRMLIIKMFYLARIDIIFKKIENLLIDVSLYRLNRQLFFKLKFINEGGGSFVVAGDLSKFSIGKGSYIKSGTYIECTGGVSIGKYCHLSRGVTILSTTHDYDNRTKIPYDEVVTPKPVVIKDFVWVGCNAIILGGVTIGEGAIIGAGSLVFKDIPDFAVAMGNPCRIVGHRDIEHFKRLKEEGKFF